MRAVVQRVTRGRVDVDDRTVGSIDRGLVVLLGVARTDTRQDAEYLADKITNLRIFEDDAGKMNCSVKQVGGQILVISQFTLLADCRKGRRPSFITAADPLEAEDLYNCFVNQVNSMGVETATGRFRASMQVALVNDGPVTLIVDS
jgi:D-tyrosyl-tRNA(Tyr) deacylase